MEKKFTPDNIQELKENQIFVFGSNMNGSHAGGAARLAAEKFGAIMGQAEDEAFYYYINEIPIADFHEQKRGLFGFNAKEVIEREILNQKGNKL